LPLTEKQKQFILNNRQQLKAKEMAKRINVSVKEVHLFLKENKQRTPSWFYILLVSIPVIFFVLLEVGLRTFNYGRDERVWVDVSEDVQILNPDVSYRYFFNTKNIPFSVESFIDKEKKGNSFRVFVLGASSGAGYPYHSSASMSKFIRKKLEILYPELTIEVPNISMSAINSYTIRDLVPEIIKKDPDLILIYLGHNEYYGALGVGSLESLGSSRFIVNTTLWLNKFKTIELLRNIINVASGLFSSSKGVTDGTLMAQMAQDKFINFNSEIFKAGISQFEGNLRDILSSFKDEGIPVITGTLVSNLKDQKPFVSINDGKYPPADEIYLKAKQELKNGNNNAVESLFVYAKELDALRFRAPNEINESIVNLCDEFGYPVVKVDSLFNSVSPGNIVGENLLTDHLHPNVEGYQLMGNLYFNAMKKYDFLPKDIEPSMDESLADSLVLAYYNFTALDSTIADFRIKILKNDWPYIKPEMKKLRNQILHAYDFIDSTAIKVIDGRITREKARLDIANFYLKRGNFNDYSTEMHALTEEFPFIYKHYSNAAQELIKAKKYSLAYSFLQKGFNKKPDAFTSKWLGIINLSQNYVDDAIFYLQKSLAYNNRDSQTLYNITGAYAEQKKFDKALDAINRCLQLNPDFPRAAAIRDQLLILVNKNK
jgi:tetratricopeptide (TPR) repeat protein